MNHDYSRLPDVNDLIGINKEKLIDDIDVVGVATMIDASNDSNVTMFI